MLNTRCGKRRPLLMDILRSIQHTGFYSMVFQLAFILLMCPTGTSSEINCEFDHVTECLCLRGDAGTGVFYTYLSLVKNGPCCRALIVALHLITALHSRLCPWSLLPQLKIN